VSTVEATAQSASERPQAPARGEELLLGQVRLVHENSLLSQLVVLFNATLLACVQWSVVNHTTVLGWLLCITMVTLGRLQLVQAFHRAKPGAADAKRWRNLFYAGAAASGLLWGGVGIFCFRQTRLRIRCSQPLWSAA
jgi:hypothetical protein